MEINNLAPIVLFIYNRPNHTIKTLEALSKNELADQSTLYIIADGPKENATAVELELIKQVRAVARQRNWCKEVIIEEKQENIGLANSIVKGVTEIINLHGKIIVLEDDIVTQVGFLKYMNQALELYKNNEKVAHISGYIYPYNQSIKVKETEFLRILSCWGWATWQRAWKNYNPDVDYHLSKIKTKQQKKKFDIEGHANYFQQLILNRDWKIKSWAVRWYASWLEQGQYSLFPSKSLISNIGMDGSGVHKDYNNHFETELANYITVNNTQIDENKRLRVSIDKYYRKFTYTTKTSTSIKKLIKSCIAAIAKLPFFDKLCKKLVPDNQQQSLIQQSTISSKARLYHPVNLTHCLVGDYTYISVNANIKYTSIGKFCSIGPNLCCGWGIHPTNGISTSPMFYSTMKQNGFSLAKFDKIKENKSIQIGNDVFIGMNVTILDGVQIGNGAIIGAGAVVSKDIPPYAIAVGNPIRIIKYRFNEEIIEKLEKIKWWDWPDNELTDVEREFMNVEKFYKKYS